MSVRAVRGIRTDGVALVEVGDHRPGFVEEHRLVIGGDGESLRINPNPIPGTHAMWLGPAPDRDAEQRQ